MPKRKGKITPNGVVLEKHENATVVFLTDLGFDIELVKPNLRKGARSPDISMSGLEWEIKSPRANSKHTVEHAFRSALGQSCNIIFDLRRSRAPVTSLKKVQKEFDKEKRAKNVIIITKEHKVIDLKR
ncbi:MAG: hypothetical protein LBL84_02545 [Candidatus Nomurabacteria bacterium]|jgi:hypothetical protein|nr:hypothetical protein [Candidatus Nomurabacteria bacterium]